MTRVLVIGLDGMAPGFLRGWVERGRFPFLAELIGEGASGVLRSTIPPYTPTAWTSIVTGVGPGRHGVFGFTRWSEEGREVLVDADDRRAKAVWEVLTEWGESSVVINVPITYPPRPILGTLVAGMGTPGGADRFTWPPEVARQLPPGYVPDVSVGAEALGTRRGREEGVRRIRRATEARIEAAERLLAARAWRFGMVVFEAPDRLQHLAWDLLVPDAPSSAERDHALAVYDLLDDGLGRIVRTERERGPLSILVVSDHGFESLRWEVFLNNHLAKIGLARLTPRPLVRIARWLPTPARRLAVAAFRRRVGDPLAASHVGSLDVERSTAFAGRVYAQGVYVGRVEDRGAVIEALMSFPRPGRGGPAIERVLVREDIYRGPHVGEAPDLLPVFRDPGVVISPGVAQRGIWKDARDTGHGTHHPEGIVIAYGPGVEPGEITGEAQDVAATVYRLLGGRTPAGLDGVPIEGVGDAEVVREEVDLTRDPHSAGYTEEEEREIAERLRSLGYLE